MDKVTIATSSGTLWLTLISHFGVGLIALVSGAIALVVAKGGRLHKKSGIVFTVAMIGLGLSAAAISAYAGKSITGGIFVVYLVFTAMTTVKELPGSSRTLDIALMVLAFGLAAEMLWSGFVVWGLPGHSFQGVPAGMIFFLGTICLLAGIGDARMIREGALRGPRRLARHLWRMCFALFIATGSFFLGQMRFLPESLQSLPLMMVLGIAPLPILLYWMWRVRLRRRLSGLIVAPRAATT
ncbi:MAG: hypothetical protein M3O61_12565 [Gemmatimonadota bacterium]|nr:hypothetical protein [Gemmatimonadota bacterium]